MFVSIKKDLIVNVKSIDVIRKKTKNAKCVVEIIIGNTIYTVDNSFIRELMKAIESSQNKLTTQFYAG